jgi:hypothetical protein
MILRQRTWDEVAAVMRAEGEPHMTGQGACDIVMRAKRKLHIRIINAAKSAGYDTRNPEDFAEVMRAWREVLHERAQNAR